MRRRRDTANSNWEDRPPAPAAPAGSRQHSAGSPWLPPSAASDGGPARLGANGRAPLGNGTGPGGGITEDYDMRQTARDLMFRVIFWPITLTSMLFKTLYRFLLHVGTSNSPLDFRDPSRWIVQTLSWPLRLTNPPVVLGVEHLEDAFLSQALASAQAGQETRRGDGAALGSGGMRHSPVLLVGNHTLLGLDCVTILDQVQARTGVYPRVMYDTLFSYIAGWRQVAELAGGVKGILGNGNALMSEGRCLMLFPGGAREAFKPSADKYKLMWNGRLGYVRMAVRYGYALIPFASVGMEDAVKVAFSVDVSWIARQLEKQNRGRLRVPFLYPYNSLERQYFAFGKAIDTSRYGGDWENTDKCSEVYVELQGVVERLIQRLQCVQQLDPDRFLLRRTWRWCRRMFEGLLGVAESRAAEMPEPSLQ